MVGLIVLFVFFPPRAWFRDQPRIPHVKEIAVLPEVQGSQVFWMEPELVAPLIPLPEQDRNARLSAILKQKYSKSPTVTRLEPIYDSEQEIKGYMAFAR